MTDHRTPDEGEERSRESARPADATEPEQAQPDPDASSDGDGSWTEDPITGVDPDEDRSVEAVVERPV